MIYLRTPPRPHHTYFNVSMKIDTYRTCFTYAAEPAKISTFFAVVVRHSKSAKPRIEKLIVKNLRRLDCKLYSTIIGAKSRTTTMKVIRRRESNLRRAGLYICTFLSVVKIRDSYNILNVRSSLRLSSARIPLRTRTEAMLMRRAWGEVDSAYIVAYVKG